MIDHRNSGGLPNDGADNGGLVVVSRDYLDAVEFADSVEFDKQEKTKQELHQSWSRGEPPIPGEVSDTVDAELTAVGELPVTVSYQVDLMTLFTQAFTELSHHHL